MKTIMEPFAAGACSLEEFADRHGMTMKITERSLRFAGPASRYFARFQDVEIARAGVLVGSYGDGRTPDEAIEAYASEIAGQHLVYRAFDEDRKEFDAPNAFSQMGRVTKG